MIAHFFIKPSQQVLHLSRLDLNNLVHKSHRKRDKNRNPLIYMSNRRSAQKTGRPGLRSATTAVCSVPMRACPDLPPFERDKHVDKTVQAMNF